MAPRPIEIGDEVTLTIRGKVVDADLAGTPDAFHLTADRPAGSDLAPIRIDVVLESSPEFHFNVKSRYSDGVHKDEQGRLWMRMPDGWHPISIDTAPTVGPANRPFTPPSPTPLVEAVQP